MRSSTFHLSSISFFLVGFIFISCVSSGKYDALQAELDETRRQLAKRDEEFSNVLKEKSALKSSIADMTTALDEARRRDAEAAARTQEYQDLLRRFKKLIDAGKLKIKIVDGRMVVALPSDILFESGSAHLSRDGVKAVEEVAVILRDVPERSFQVEGHTDNVPIRTLQFPSNWELGAARALSVVNVMAKMGVPQMRISGASYADTRPVKPNDTIENKAANRRIEIVVVPDLRGLPGFDELKKLSEGEEN